MLLSSILPRLALDETVIASDVIKGHFMGYATPWTLGCVPELFGLAVR